MSKIDYRPAWVLPTRPAECVRAWLVWDAADAWCLVDSTLHRPGVESALIRMRWDDPRVPALRPLPVPPMRHFFVTLQGRLDEPIAVRAYTEDGARRWAAEFRAGRPVVTVREEETGRHSA